MGSLLLLLIVSCWAGNTELLPYNPVANLKAVVTIGNARFTVLTPHLIRMEYSPTGKFEDCATLAVVNRDLPVPSFDVSNSSGVLTIKTQAPLTLTYKQNQPFSAATLQITTPDFRWSYGDPNYGNLLGTIKSLDLLDAISLNCTENQNTTVHAESLHCSWGLISRKGWAVVDDSKNWCVENDFWSGTNKNQIDSYFFGHGNKYTQAIHDYTLIGGKVAMVPRQASGIWWSRWYDLNNYDVFQIVEKYKTYSLPLDVFVLDMDWHTKDGWGGYTWDTRLFPIPSLTMDGLHEHGLLVTANLHDDDGIRPSEKMYTEFARLMGVTDGKTIPYQICSNETYCRGLEDIVLGDVERQGMDFWWIDWQQGGKQGGCHGEEQNPTIWLNKLRATDSIRRNDPKRGIVLGRWGGLGNHRYQVGFSGDVKTLSWSNLAYQPYFSYTASNVLYGYWSHDLVGPYNDYELHTRWLQFGAYSAIFRTHDRGMCLAFNVVSLLRIDPLTPVGMATGACGNISPPPCAIIEVWNVPQIYFDANRDAMVARAALLPYIYHAVRQSYDTGLSILRPMYYEFPAHNEAYLGDRFGKFPQYMFGDHILVSPIVTPGRTNDTMAIATVWIPPGQWYELETGNLHSTTTGFTLTKPYDLSEIPVFIRGGAIIPRIPVRSGNTIGLSSRQYTHLEFSVYPGKNAGQTEIYEDDGATTDYVYGRHAFTKVSYGKTFQKFTFVIDGHSSLPYASFPTSRTYSVHLVSHFPANSVTIDGKLIPYKQFGGPNTWRYHANSFTLIVETGERRYDQKTEIIVNHNTFVDSLFSQKKGKLIHSVKAKQALDVGDNTPGSSDTKGGKLQLAASYADFFTSAAINGDANGFLLALGAFDQLFSEAIAETTALGPGPQPGSPREQHWAHALGLLLNL